MESGSLWATHYEYLNDATELVHGQELIRRAIEERVQACPGHIRNFMSYTYNECNNAHKDYSVYISCFCQKDDLLSQWRSYSAGGGGCSIGFAVRTLLPDGDVSVPLLHAGFGLTQVLYEEQDKFRLVHGVIDKVVGMLEEYDRLEPSCTGNPERLGVGPK